MGQLAELLACPFCGGEAATEDDQLGTVVQCTACGVCVGPCCESEAVVAWNRRASSDRHVALARKEANDGN